MWASCQGTHIELGSGPNLRVFGDCRTRCSLKFIFVLCLRPGSYTELASVVDVVCVAIAELGVR